MAAHLCDGLIVGVVIVIPEYSQYIVMENNKTLYSQPISFVELNDNGTVYYAYPPRQTSEACHARVALQDLIDDKSAGMYRYGSACVGLYQLLCGRHLAFIGHEIRLWDALAYLPILVLNQIEVRYYIKGLSITLLASARLDFIESAAQILQQKQSIILKKYNLVDVLIGDI
jgi:fructose-1,6-bisphosphatase/inositol monophosphatase family enzyme